MEFEMADDKKHKHIKVIDVEAIDEKDDANGGPVDTVDILDSVSDAETPRRQRNKRLEDIENPLSNEDSDVVEENLFPSEPDNDEQA